MALHPRFATHTATVERRTRTSDGAGGFPETWTAAGSVVGSLQPAGAAETNHGDQGLAEHRWVFYCDPDTVIVRDDRLTIGGDRYHVLSVARWVGATVVDHAAVQLEQLQRGA